jgi:hypothetical protein
MQFTWLMVLLVFVRLFQDVRCVSALRGEKLKWLKCNKKGPRSNSRAFILVAGALRPDSESAPTLTALWWYASERQGARKMRRVGLVT